MQLHSRYNIHAVSLARFIVHSMSLTLLVDYLPHIIALQYNCYARYTYYGHTLELEQNTSGLLKVCLQL